MSGPDDGDQRSERGAEARSAEGGRVWGGAPYSPSPVWWYGGCARRKFFKKSTLKLHISMHFCTVTAQAHAIKSLSFWGQKILKPGQVNMRKSWMRRRACLTSMIWPTYIAPLVTGWSLLSFPPSLIFSLHVYRSLLFPFLHSPFLFPSLSFPPFSSALNPGRGPEGAAINSPVGSRQRFSDILNVKKAF